MDDTVIVRSITHDEWQGQLSGLQVFFGGRTQVASTKPTRDAKYVAFYRGTPDSAITHLGLVSEIERSADLLRSDVFHLKCLIALEPPIPCGHPVANFLYTTLEELGISRVHLTLKREPVTFR